MKKLLFLFAALVILSAGMAYGYDENTTAQITINAYMVSLSYTISLTTIYFDGGLDNGLQPNEDDGQQQTGWDAATSIINVENTGGVTMDLEAYIWDEDTYAPDWVQAAAFTLTPGLDTYTLCAYMEYYDGAYSTVSYSAATAAGFLNDEAGPLADFAGSSTNIVAYSSGDADADNRELYFRIVAPSSATDPGTSAAGHVILVAVNGSASG